MPNISLTLACGPYAHTEALASDAVRLEGIDLTFLPIESPPEIFTRMMANQAFDACEMSLSHYFRHRLSGDFPFVALPVFPLRKFRHSFIVINADSGVRVPQDLAGRRLGVMEYSQTAAVWIRGMLQDEYGVAAESILWFTGGVNQPGHPKVLQQKPDAPVSIEYIGDGRTLNQMLLDGELDAVIGARLPRALGHDPRIQRLFPDYRRVEQQYFRQTGIFPIMHAIVMREELYRQKPWVAESLYKGFEASARLAWDAMHDDGNTRLMLPWLAHDVEELKELCGGNPWRSGVEVNRHVLETLAGYLHRERFVPAPLNVDALFVPIVSVSE
ncbi:MAG: ABC transporter substrate-binding protein [Acidobacteria bacterium]|nr:ABC transporter substrate-binding protein [Acidobacteriota bacterium]